MEVRLQLATLLIDALKDPNPNVRAGAAACLAKKFLNSADKREANIWSAVSAALQQALPDLIVSLKTGDPRGRVWIHAMSCGNWVRLPNQPFLPSWTNLKMTTG